LFPNKDEWVTSSDAVVYKHLWWSACSPNASGKGLLMADIDVEAARSSQRKFDASGHYTSPDIFNLTVNRKAMNPVSFNK